MKTQKLILIRQGVVDWYIAGDNHCGVAKGRESRVETKYGIKLVCKPKTDKRGFLVDQLWLDAYVQKYASAYHTASCELTCIALARALFKALPKHCSVLRLVVTLSPAPFAASMTVELTN